MMPFVSKMLDILLATRYAGPVILVKQISGSMAAHTKSNKKLSIKEKLHQKEAPSGFFSQAFHHSAPMFVKPGIEKELFAYRSNQNNIFQAAHP